MNGATAASTITSSPRCRRPTRPSASAANSISVSWWRFDERIFVDGYPFIEVNVDDRQKSLRILEASGDYEIGDWRLPGPASSATATTIPFRFGYKTELGARTVPNNWNNDWAHTGWEITDIQEAPPESHTLFVRAADGITGWPRSLPAGADTLLLDVQSAVAATVVGAGSGARLQ